MAILALAMALMDKWTEVQISSEKNEVADISPFIYFPIQEKLYVSWDGGCTFNKSILPFLIYKIIDRCNRVWLWRMVKKIEEAL